MVKPLSFKGDKKPKKRKRADAAAKEALDNDDASLVQADPDTDDSWVSADAAAEVSGPVLLVLPTTPPSALACDAGGAVFALAVENIVDGNPASAEPHDVRQVWIANRVVGTELLRFKGSHGKYLSCDSHGLLSAASTAIAPPESFALLPAPASGPGAFRLRTHRDTFVSAAPGAGAKGPEVRGDADDEDAPGTALRVRMQARFRPRTAQARREEERARDKVSRRELEEAAGRKLEDDEVRRLKRARREGDYHEQLLVLKVKGKHDKFG